MTHVTGPWSEDQSDRFGDWSRCLAEDLTACDGLRAAARNRVHILREVMGEEHYKSSKLVNEFMEPLNITDQALGIYRRADGSELLIAAMALENTGNLTNGKLRNFTAIAPFAARAWATAWRYEPAWVMDLKPTTVRVLESVMDGLDDEQIGDRLGITYHAVRAHMKRLFREAGVRSRLHLMQEYRKQRAGLAGAMPHAAALNADDSVTTVIDPADTAFGMVTPASA
jgi:DNA-binding CsgD family transcriptional regulator